MAALDFRDFGDEFVLHYGSESHVIDGRTLTQSLGHFINALQVVNDRIAPGTEMRIYVHALGPGSFRIKLSKKQRKFFEKLWEKADSIVLQVLAAVIAAKIIGSEQSPGNTIQINGDVIIVQQGENTITLPGGVKDDLQKLLSDDKLDSEISQSFEVLNNDEEVRNLGIAESIEDDRPLFSLGKRDIAVLSEKRNVEGRTDRYSDSEEELRILKAVFERGKRKWQFIRGNTKISASISDATFFDRLANREIIIGDGDTLVVLLRTHQIWNDLVGVWVDDSYEIVKVFDHRKRAIQLSLD